MSARQGDATVIVPIRKGSQRIIRKNVQSIGPFGFGLTEIKLRQLLAGNTFAEILIDTDLEEIDQVLAVIGSTDSTSKVRVEVRDPKLAGSDATTDDLIRHLVKKVNTPHLVWTHVTSPFFNTECYARFMERYRNLPPEHDSLVAADTLREFLWKKDGPMNYDRNGLRWPFTQTLDPIYLINSAGFAISTELAQTLGDRVGETPAFFECEVMEGFDVDWPDQFQIVKLLVQNGYKII